MMTETVDLIGTDPERVCFYERAPEYANGEVLITGAKVVRDVPLTPSIEGALRAGAVRKVTQEVEEETIALTALDGIGDKTAVSLSELGVHTVQDMSRLVASDLAPELKDAFGQEKLAAWINAAVEAVAAASASE